VAAGRALRTRRLVTRRLRPAVLLAALVALALLAFPSVAGKFYLQLFSTIMIMAIFAMSLNLLVGCAGLVSLGHAAFFGIGAYIYVKPDAALFGLTPFRLADAHHFYYLVLALMAATYLVLRIILRAPFGHALQGIRVNEHRMRALGFATFRYKLAAFVIAGGLAGLAGYLDAAQFGTVSPDLFGWRQSGIVLMMVILGGKDKLYGAILGAFALVLLQDVLADATRHWLLPMGLFILLAVLVLPRGLSGLAARLRAVRRREARGA